MSPELVTAIAYLLAEALAAGVQINDIIQKSKDTGIVPDDVWDAIIADMDSAVADWKAASGK